MAEDARAGGSGHEIDVTSETMDTLATKLDAFGESLSDDERVVLGTVLKAGMHSMSSDVTGFGAGGDLSFGLASPLGAEVRRYDIVGAFPKKLEFGQMKAGDTS